ncbi:TPA: type 1 fimbrial protein [Enterobacter soli]|nr:type 1 fimbrial protein [Enterobacter soli]
MHFFKTVRLVLPFMLMATLPGKAIAWPKDEGSGTVAMKGSIIDTPCAIDIDDQAQVVEMGSETTGEIIHNGFGPVKTFRIHLVNCVLHQSIPHRPDWSGFQVTFDGKHDNTFFGVNGAAGIGVKILDSEGNQAIPGIPMSKVALKPGKQFLDYTLQLVSDRHRLVAGNYRTTIRFKVDYF